MQRGCMLENNDVEAIQRDLMAENYHQLLSDLRSIGCPIKKAWDAKLLREQDKTAEKYKFTSNNLFKQFLVKEIEKSKIAESANIKDIPQHIYLLKNQLSRLALVLMVWKDDPNLSQESTTEQPEELNLSEIKKKKLRQQIKFKSSLDKDDRYALHIALQAMVFILYQQSNHFVKQQKSVDNRPFDFTLKDNTNPFININSKEKLINFISDHIDSLKKFESSQYPGAINKVSSLSKQQEIEKIGEAIDAFQTPNKKKKIIKYAGILLALIASLACGLATGGAIILLFPSLSTTAFILGGLIAVFGFKANFGFFSKNFPDFILSLIKKGGISEYIDIYGNRKQFSATYKYLLTPLLVLASLTVGAGTTALAYITVLGLVAKLLPIFAIIWPPLPLIIVGVLAVAVGIALTVSVLTASLELLKKVAALNLGFKGICQYAYEKCREWFKNLKNLKAREKVGLVIMLLLLPVALAGLAYFRYIAGVDLAVFIGIAGAIVMGIVAYIPQMAFTYLSINKFKNILTTTQAEDNLSPKSLLNRAKSVLSVSWYWLGLTINAIGNAILVYTGSAVSIVGAIACGLNSLTGSLSGPDMNQNKRKQATQGIVQEYEGFMSKPKTESSMLANPRSSDNDLNKLTKPREWVSSRSESVEEPIMTSKFRKRSVSDSTYNRASYFKPVEKDIANSRVKLIQIYSKK
jgi:hypothetical protein